MKYLGIGVVHAWRWTFGRGVTMTARVGGGYARYMLGGAAADAAEGQMEDRLEPLPFELDSELSIGLSFCRKWRDPCPPRLRNPASRRAACPLQHRRACWAANHGRWSIRSSISSVAGEWIAGACSRSSA